MLKAVVVGAAGLSWGRQRVAIWDIVRLATMGDLPLRDLVLRDHGLIVAPAGQWHDKGVGRATHPRIAVNGVGRATHGKGVGPGVTQ